MSRIDEIRARLDAATPSMTGIVRADRIEAVQARSDLLRHAPADLRALLAVAEAARVLLLFDSEDEKRDRWCALDDALDALDGAR